MLPIHSFIIQLEASYLSSSLKILSIMNELTTKIFGGVDYSNQSFVRYLWYKVNWKLNFFLLFYFWIELLTAWSLEKLPNFTVFDYLVGSLSKTVLPFNFVHSLSCVPCWVVYCTCVVQFLLDVLTRNLGLVSINDRQTAPPPSK